MKTTSRVDFLKNISFISKAIETRDDVVFSNINKSTSLFCILKEFFSLIVDEKSRNAVRRVLI